MGAAFVVADGEEGSARSLALKWVWGRIREFWYSTAGSSGNSFRIGAQNVEFASYHT